MNFWNGNKSSVRQAYELAVLEAITETFAGQVEIIDDRTDYPLASQEGAVFDMGSDLLVTVFGNRKFNNKEKIVVPTPIARGLLGKRVLIIRETEHQEFASIESDDEMKHKVCGIPATWADADLFRANGYKVLEKGSLEDIFHRLAKRECDYVALGAIEVEAVFDTFAKGEGGLCLEKSLMLEYPLPLVFYVNPQRADLAKSIQEGLLTIGASGRAEELFQRHFGATIQRLSLESRRTFHLKNPSV